MQFKSELNLSDSDVHDILSVLCDLGEETRIFYLWRPFIKDPFDDHVLELALASQSKYIVTYNQKDFKRAEQLNIHAITPATFLQEMELL